MASLPPWLGLMAAAIAASRGALDMMSTLVQSEARREENSPHGDRNWTTAHRTLRTLTTMRVLDFSIDRPGAAAIIVAPFALHAATTADFAPRHSVVEALLEAGVTRLVLTDWRSAEPRDRFLAIDAYIADLNVVVDDFGAPAALVGLCQGGWLAAAYAARFPDKVSRLVLVGAPIDVAAAPSNLALIAQSTPPEAIEELVGLGEGLLLGKVMQAMWPMATPGPADILDILQLPDTMPHAAAEALAARFNQWHGDVVDLPGVFYREVVGWIFRENRLAAGTFRALGEEIALRRIVCPLFLLAGDRDEITAPAQLLALAGLAGSDPAMVERQVASGRHLSLFMGRHVLTRIWPDIGRFLSRSARRKPNAA